MQQPIRVTIVARSLMMGGIQRHIVKLCNELAGENIAISVCLLINDEPKDLIHELPPQTSVHIFPHRRHDLRTVFWLAKIIGSEKSQIVHSFSWHADFYSSFLKLLVPGLVFIGSERGDRSAANFYTSKYEWTDRLLVYPLADRFCANSQFGKGLLVAGGYPLQKIEVIPNGINLTWLDSQPRISLRDRYGWSTSSTVCCIVSRLVDYKGIDTFIKLVQSCQEEIKFVIIGDGPEKERLSSLIADLGARDKIILAGQLNPAIPYIKDADICVLPNKDSEHCSNSILEYMACGKPVIAMNIAGNPELITTGLNGFLITPANIEELPLYLDRLAADKGLAIQMGSAGRARIDASFQMSDVASRFYSLWKGFVSNKGGF